ncbi:hypothetical protein PAMP_014491 [Pampus punctatissimus]
MFHQQNPLFNPTSGEQARSSSCLPSAAIIEEGKERRGRKKRGAPDAIDFSHLKSGNPRGKESIGQPAFNYEVHKDTEIGADVMDGLQDAMIGSMPVSAQA